MSPKLKRLVSAFKSPSHLMHLSISHALAQSTLLSYYESSALKTLTSPLPMSIPVQLAKHGQLKLSRTEALKGIYACLHLQASANTLSSVTGTLFRLRVSVNLVSSVLDVPELFWSEASLGELYNA